eukprot:m.270737 g.270737  ORF g.270737 m.270737 type:complete len:96 (-) comp54765_c0_seq14:1129-1416(-)
MRLTLLMNTQSHKLLPQQQRQPLLLIQTTRLIQQRLLFRLSFPSMTWIWASEPLILPSDSFYHTLCVIRDRDCQRFVPYSFQLSLMVHYFLPDSA